MFGSCAGERKKEANFEAVTSAAWGGAGKRVTMSWGSSWLTWSVGAVLTEMKLWWTLKSFPGCCDLFD